MHSADELCDDGVLLATLGLSKVGSERGVSR